MKHGQECKSYLITIHNEVVTIHGAWHGVFTDTILVTQRMPYFFGLQSHHNVDEITKKISTKIVSFFDQYMKK